MAKAKPKPKPDKPALPPVPRKHLSEQSVAEAITRYSGNLAAVARSFAVVRSSVWEYVHARPDLVSILRDARETRVDNAESSLDHAVLKGEGWAVTLILKTLGKDRGYVERTETDIRGEVKTVTEVVIHTREEADAILALMKPDEPARPDPAPREASRVS